MMWCLHPHKGLENLCLSPSALLAHLPSLREYSFSSRGAEGQETLDWICWRTESLGFHLKWQNPNFKAYKSLLFNPGATRNLIFSLKVFQAPTFPSLRSPRTGSAQAGLRSSEPCLNPWQFLAKSLFAVILLPVSEPFKGENLWRLRVR